MGIEISEKGFSDLDKVYNCPDYTRPGHTRREQAPSPGPERVRDSGIYPSHSLTLLPDTTTPSAKSGNNTRAFDSTKIIP